MLIFCPVLHAILLLAGEISRDAISKRRSTAKLVSTPEDVFRPCICSSWSPDSSVDDDKHKVQNYAVLAVLSNITV